MLKIIREHCSKVLLSTTHWIFRNLSESLLKVQKHLIMQISTRHRLKILILWLRLNRRITQSALGATLKRTLKRSEERRVGKECRSRKQSGQREERRRGA